MTNGYQALTEREKETLRLLINGYDAKSMARHLGLSVHTINERLRDARRKLSVSSSREAARMVREAEGSPPDLLGDKRLGEAGEPPAMATDVLTSRSSGMIRRSGWMIGGLAVTFALALYALVSLSGEAQTDATTPTENAAETAAVEAGRTWLALVDQSDWENSWKTASNTFRSLNTVAKWTEASQHVRVPLGGMLSRELATVDFAPAPPNGYWNVKFRTRFANKAAAIETVALVWEDGRWKVTGVTID